MLYAYSIDLYSGIHIHGLIFPVVFDMSFNFWCGHKMPGMYEMEHDCIKNGSCHFENWDLPVREFF